MTEGASERALVIVVDDDPGIGEMLTTYLRAKGFDVLSVASGLGVGALILRHRPVAIILDVMMPALDGEGLTRLLRSQPNTKHVPIVLYSAANRARLVDIGERLGDPFVGTDEGLGVLLKALRAATKKA